LNRELAITENQIDQKSKLVKSSDRLDKVSRQVGSRGMPQSGIEASINENSSKARQRYTVSPDMTS